MNAEGVVLVGATALFVVSVASGRLERAWLSEPIVAVVLGMVTAGLLQEPVDLESPLILTVLELTLALVLFADASRIDVKRLREGYSWPLRMLGVGMPVVIVLGAAFSGWLLSLPLGVALLIGVVLAPTDAALAEPVIVSKKVPPRIRQALNIESGLNDGLAVPALLVAIGVIESDSRGSAVGAAGLVISQLGIGVLGGIVLGWLGSAVIGGGGRNGGIDRMHEKIAALALALGGFAAVQLLGGSGFVATFIAGAVMSYSNRIRGQYVYHFAETEGHSLVLVAFFVFGAGPAMAIVSEGVPLQAAVVALVSLLVLRPVAIGLSLVGLSLSRRTIWFLGWFGPRGLATIVFTLVVTEELGALDGIVADTVMLTVMLSILVHGLTAVPMSRWLASGMMDMPEDMPEMGEAYEYPSRRS